MNQVRTAAVAGTFYPSHPATLNRDLATMLTDAKTDSRSPKAIIAPHAGYIYSGAIAASLYARVRNGASKIHRVVVMGPSHRVGFKGIAASSADSFRTPLGDIPIDREAIKRVVGLPNTGILDAAHQYEHSLEVHLPFLQTVLDDFTLVPLVIGDAAAEDVARVLKALWGGDETLVVISSDLSHYKPYREAQRADEETCRKIEALETDIQGDQACGCRPINGLLQVARDTGLTIEAIDIRNSGDTSGAQDSVVGYGAFVVYENQQPGGKRPAHDHPEQQAQIPAVDTLAPSHRQLLLQIARNSIEHQLSAGRELVVELDRLPEAITCQLASFVTINLHGRLRGCIGSLVAHRPLATDVAANAFTAAFRDPRFAPLSVTESADIEVHISVLSEPQAMSAISREELITQLRPDIDGLIIEEQGHRATYLPSVWRQLPDPDQFVAELRAKAGLSRQDWSAHTKVYRYTTEEFS
jgi:hypothetical protein